MNPFNCADRNTRAGSSTAGFYAKLAVFCLSWSGLILFISLLDVRQTKDWINHMVQAEARSNFNKDLLYRRWAAMQGGVYVPESEFTPPNPHLAHVANRDQVTSSGMRLTLVNPAYMTRQVHEIGKEQYGARGHITSLNPIRPRNAPDPWERKALLEFEQGAEEVAELADLNGELHMRLMRPMITEKGCLTCHAQQGYELGQIRGGISVSLPMAPYQAAADTMIGRNMLWMGSIWAMGMGLLLLGGRYARRQSLERQDAFRILSEREQALTVLHENARDGFYFMQFDEPVDVSDGAPSPGQVETILQDLRITQANRAMIALTRRAGVELVGMTLAEVIGHPALLITREQAIGYFTQALATGQSSTDIAIRLLNGSKVHLEGRYNAILTQDGRLAGFFGTERDVTERIEHQRVIEQQEKRLQTIISSSNIGTWDWNMQTGSIEFSAQWARMVGYEPGEIEPTIATFEQLTHPDDYENTMRIIQDHIDGKSEILEAEFRMRHKGGHDIWVFGKGRIIEHDDQGQPLHMIGTNVEITQVKKIEHDFEMIFEQMVEGLALHQIICDAEGRPVDYRFLAANPAYEQMTGQKAADILGRTVLEVLPEIEPHWIETYGRVALGGPTINFTEYSSVLDRWFEVSAYSPQPGQFVCLVSDITGRRQLEQQLIQSQKMEAVGQLAGGIAHDFNNLLQVINGYADLAAMDLDPGHPSAASIAEIAQAGKRARTLAGQLLTFSRRQVIKMEPLEMGRILFELTGMLKRLLGEQISIQLADMTKPMMFKGDRSMIEQVIMNLCINGRDAMPEGGELDIRVTSRAIDENLALHHQGLAPGSYVCLSIRDNGTGMDEETRSRIFEPFFSTKAQGQGTGLGLSTVYGIVHQHGGFLLVESEPGEGTTFEVFLPASTEAGQQAAETTSLPPVGELDQSDHHVFVVEDEERVRKITVEILERAGFRVSSACDGQEAVEHIARNGRDIDIILMDIIMPRLNGRDAYEQIKLLRPELPVLFASGYDGTSQHQQILEKEGLTILQKPYKREDLLAALGKTLQRA